MANELGAAGLRLEREGPIAWCVIDRPEAQNALTPAMYFGIKRAVHLVNQDPELAALIITGTAMCSPPAATSAAGVSRTTNRPRHRIRYLALPHDPRQPCSGRRRRERDLPAGGLLIAVMADICVASDGHVPRPGVARASPMRRTRPCCRRCGCGRGPRPPAVGATVRCREAQRLGVITRVVPHEQLRESTLEAVREILLTPPMARMHVKRMLNERYGLVDYQTMFWALAESDEPRRHAGVHGEAAAELGPRRSGRRDLSRTRARCAGSGGEWRSPDRRIARERRAGRSR